MNKTLEEVQIFAGVAERTGRSVDRGGLRGRANVCRSLSELCAKARRLGDGYYYIAQRAWPADAETVDVVRAWSPLS